jgi:hypothetical protein
MALPGQSAPVRRGCRISRARRPGSERRREMSRSKSFWNVAEKISRREADLFTLPSIYATASGESGSAVV